MATNAAMLAAKPARRKPAEIAAELVDKLFALPEVAKAEAAGPGFVNLTLKPEVLQGVAVSILKAGDQYGRSTMGQGRA